MAKAVYSGVVLAESDAYEVVEGNVYFPPESINRTYFQESDLTTVCPWKGTASYYDIVVDGEKVQNAAWYYPTPKSAASNILNHVAFYRMVDVQR
ncbi:MAG: DUF427 domain-containing protein [Chloroflexota bacterium]